MFELDKYTDIPDPVLPPGWLVRDVVIVEPRTGTEEPEPLPYRPVAPSITAPADRLPTARAIPADQEPAPLSAAGGGSTPPGDGPPPLPPGGDELPPPEEEPPVADSQPAAEMPDATEGAVELASFEPYRQFTEDVNYVLDAGQPPNIIKGYLPSGGTCVVIETPDGNVLKIPRVESCEHEHDNEQPVLPEPDAVRTDYIVPLSRGKGGVGLEQIITATEEGRGAVVCEKAPGTRYDRVPQEVRDTIPKPHFDRLMVTAEEIAVRHLRPDYDPANLIYQSEAAARERNDDEGGFIIIDYGTIEQYDEPPQTPLDIVKIFTMPTFIFDRPDENNLTPAELNFRAAVEDAFGHEAVEEVVRYQHEQWDQLRAEGLHPDLDFSPPQDRDAEGNFTTRSTYDESTGRLAVVVKGGMAYGYVDPDSPEISLDMLAVRQQYRRAGRGGHVVRQFAREAAAMGMERLHSVVVSPEAMRVMGRVFGSEGLLVFGARPDNTPEVLPLTAEQAAATIQQGLDAVASGGTRRDNLDIFVSVDLTNQTVRTHLGLE